MITNAAELKRRYSQRVAGMRDDKAYIGPEIVTMEIASACNLRCHFCMADHSPGNPDHFEKAKFLPWEKFLGIIHDCVDLNVDQVNLQGSGETTMHPSFRDMMRHLEQQPLKVVLVTNATFPLEYCSDVIKGDHVIINLSAVDRQQYLDLKGKDLFDRVVDNIKRLVFLRDTCKPGFYIEIVYVVNTVNVDQKQKMQDMASQLGVNSVDFRKMEQNAYNLDIILPEDSGGEEKRTPPACLNGWFFMLVMSGGNLKFCHKVPQMHPADLDRWSLKQYWFSSQMTKIRLLGKYGRIQKMYEACQSCPFYEENTGLKENQRFWRPAKAEAQLFIAHRT